MAKEKDNIDGLFDDYNKSFPSIAEDKSALRRRSEGILDRTGDCKKKEVAIIDLSNEKQKNKFLVATGIAAIFVILTFTSLYFLIIPGVNDNTNDYALLKTISISDNSKALSENESVESFSPAQKTEIINLIKNTLRQNNIEFESSDSPIVKFEFEVQGASHIIELDINKKIINILIEQGEQNIERKDISNAIEQIESSLQELLFKY